MSVAKVELGRHLFYDARLSGNGTLACSGCHAPDRAFTDNRALGRGATGQNHPRNTPTLINAAYQATLDWANPASRTLEQQMHTPLFNTTPIEMGVNDANREQVLQRLKTTPSTRRVLPPPSTASPRRCMGTTSSRPSPLSSAR